MNFSSILKLEETAPEPNKYEDCCRSLSSKPGIETKQVI